MGLDKPGYQVNIFLISSRKHIVGTQKCHAKVLLMSTNKCFCGEIGKLLLLSD